jgi:hypothetical protein
MSQIDGLPVETRKVRQPGGLCTGEEEQSDQDAKCATQRWFGPPWPRRCVCQRSAATNRCTRSVPVSLRAERYSGFRRPIQRRCGDASYSESGPAKKSGEIARADAELDRILRRSASIFCAFGACDPFLPSQRVARPARDKPIC